MTMLPSPTLDATRLTESQRTSTSIPFHFLRQPRRFRIRADEDKKRMRRSRLDDPIFSNPRADGFNVLGSVNVNDSSIRLDPNVVFRL
jgi:hypothetical protein